MKPIRTKHFVSKPKGTQQNRAAADPACISSTIQTNSRTEKLAAATSQHCSCSCCTATGPVRPAQLLPPAKTCSVHIKGVATIQLTKLRITLHTSLITSVSHEEAGSPGQPLPELADVGRGYLAHDDRHKIGTLRLVQHDQLGVRAEDDSRASLDVFGRCGAVRCGAVQGVCSGKITGKLQNADTTSDIHFRWNVCSAQTRNAQPNGRVGWWPTEPRRLVRPNVSYATKRIIENFQETRRPSVFFVTQGGIIFLSCGVVYRTKISVSPNHAVVVRQTDAQTAEHPQTCTCRDS